MANVQPMTTKVNNTGFRLLSILLPTQSQRNVIGHPGLIFITDVIVILGLSDRQLKGTIKCLSVTLYQLSQYRIVVR